MQDALPSGQENRDLQKRCAAAAVKQPQDETSKVAHLEGELIKN